MDRNAGRLARITQQELERIAHDFSSPSFRFRFRKSILPGGKPGWVAERSDPASYFCMKQLQANIRSVFKVRQGNRHQIVVQLKTLLGDRLPKCIVRTDVQDFFETIDRRSLLQDVMQHSLLSVTSKRLVRDFFNSCPGSGLPRGLGLSAVLSEVAMRRLDRRIQDLGGVIYYGRYVDDIVVVFATEQRRNAADYQARVTDAISSFGLTPNLLKTRAFNLPDSTTIRQFDYLGYRFSCLLGGGLELGLSSRRIQKYRIRIMRSLVDYRATSRADEKKARRLLISRLRFLAENTRLANNKKHVYVGAFFSNPHLTDLNELRALDAYLRLRSSRLPHPVRAQINDLSFEAGHLERRFVEFSPRELERVGKVWADA